MSSEGLGHRTLVFVGDATAAAAGRDRIRDDISSSRWSFEVLRRTHTWTERFVVVDVVVVKVRPKLASERSREEQSRALLSTIKVVAQFLNLRQ